jgi:hypothetical protein
MSKGKKFGISNGGEYLNSGKSNVVDNNVENINYN